MLRCPACRSHKHIVRNSRTKPGTIRRLRGCLVCDERWVTFEVSEAAYAALTELDGLLQRVGKAIACSAAVVEEARGEGLLIQHDFDLRPDEQKRRKRGRTQTVCDAPQATGA